MTSKFYNPESSNKVYSAIIAELLEALENGTPVWRKTWNYQQYAATLHNPLSDAPFTGRNVFLLTWFMMIRGYESPLFATAKQIVAAGGKINEGESGMPVVMYTPVKEKTAAAARLNIKESDVQPGDREVAFLSPRYYRVYNIVAQTTGIEVETPEFSPVISEFTPIELCEQLVAGYTDAPTITTGNDGRATYTGGRVDTVSMPPRVAFDNEQEYYATLFHELAHSTGNSKRLNRDMSGDNKSKSYAVEELVAEITAALLCGETGIANATLENSAAYVAGWLQALKDNPDILFKAIVGAMDAADYIQKTGKFAPAQLETV